MPRAAAALSSRLIFANGAVSRPASPQNNPNPRPLPMEPEMEPEPEEGVRSPRHAPESPHPGPEPAPMDLSFEDVTLYDGHTRSRQKGRLQITRTELSFTPAKAGKGAAVSFPLATIEDSPQAVGTGWRLSLAVAKIEARVRVDQEQPAFDVAFEFGNRERERDEALQAIMIMARGAFGVQLPDWKGRCRATMGKPCAFVWLGRARSCGVVGHWCCLGLLVLWLMLLLVWPSSTPHFSGSRLLTTPEWGEQLNVWAGKGESQEWRLCCSTLEGCDTAAKFHAGCDAHTPTLTVARNDGCSEHDCPGFRNPGGFVFGGFVRSLPPVLLNSADHGWFAGAGDGQLVGGDLLRQKG